MSSRVNQVLAMLEDLHNKATPEPWFLGWDMDSNTEEDDPTAVCVMDPGGMAPLLEIAEEHLDDAETADDLRVTEGARNALPLLLKVARALQKLDTLIDFSQPLNQEAMIFVDQSLINPAMADARAALDGIIVLLPEAPE